MNKIPEFVAQIIPALPDKTIRQCRAALPELWRNCL